MNLIFRSHHADVDDELKAYAETKISRIEKLLPRVADVVIEFEHQETRLAGQRHRAEITVHSAVAMLRAEERAAEPRAALDKTIAVVMQQARRHSKRLHERHREAGGKQQASDIANAPAPGDAIDDEFAPAKPLRVKTFEAKPMSQEEALAQMDLIGHDFFLYLDAATSDYALLYKREDGGYGLLAPRRG